MDRDGLVLSVCGAPPLNRKATGNGIPLLKKGAINLYMNMPCPLKVVCKMVIGEFVELYNSSHEVPIYSPMLLDGDSKGIEGELKAAMTEEELPERLVASGLHRSLGKRGRCSVATKAHFTFQDLSGKIGRASV